MGNVANICEEWMLGPNGLLTFGLSFLRRLVAMGRKSVLTEGQLIAFGLGAGGQGCYFESMFSTF